MLEELRERGFLPALGIGLKIIVSGLLYLNLSWRCSKVNPETIVLEMLLISGLKVMFSDDLFL
jgi:hypothetical protein